ncbi:MAG: DUF1365 domain-containing protein [Cellvibrionaceae bacterium]
MGIDSSHNDTALASAVYHGTVRHRRYTPKNHEFTYNVFMVYLDLHELDQVFSTSRWWSNKKFNLAWFKRKDFLDGRDDSSLYDGVAKLVERETGRLPQGPIRMLTNLRYFGFIINPITCYYCFDSTGQQLETVVAEVTNTPWRQRCHYVLNINESDAENKQQFTFAKSMHVSPFQPMDLEYQWKGKTPADDLLVHIDVCQDSQAVFDATMVLKHQPMTQTVMNKVVFRYPWMTLKVFGAIYWQAIKLAIKKIPYFSNPTSNTPSNNESLTETYLENDPSSGVK